CRAHCPNLFSGGNDPNHVSRDKPLYLVSRANAIAIRHRLWNRDLKLRRNLSHILTIARVSSLFKCRLEIGWKNPGLDESTFPSSSEEAENLGDLKDASDVW